MVVQSDRLVAQYTGSGKDETTDYSGYKFKFNTAGTFVAALATAIFNGTWLLATAPMTVEIIQTMILSIN